MKLWDGSLKGHLRFYRPSATNYVVRGVGTFAIIAIMFPGSPFPRSNPDGSGLCGRGVPLLPDCPGHLPPTTQEEIPPMTP